ncbi:NAD(P)-dependent oxidoreductase [Pontimonas salivibrio]|uniref:NAD(P)-dependent oxidoreductase n=1 Tax=Pontimonas salivibrio TaxID=1159327 RepID=A0A2L2BRI1_9MICO|nr:FAD-dependent oxidoreductase [Pontimonas salivibrio]AVG24237.1 NAD(P)-dependent oxidoreductase [Pontimonas salivibrio]
MSGVSSPLIPESVDVVVVGGGGSGLSAAVSAAKKGLKVALFERNAEVGGTTIMSVGSFTAAGTTFQKRKKIADSVDWMMEDMWKFDEELLTNDAPHLRRLYATHSARALHWLQGLGVAFAGPYPEAPHRVPRMHNVIPNSKTYGVRLLEAAKRAGVTVITGAAVDDLTVDDGRVSGVQVTRGGKTSTVAARVGVVLASGDFSASRALRDANLSVEAATALPINQDALGLGHEFAIKHGAGTKNMDMLFGPQLRFPVPEKGGFLDRLPTWKWLCQIEAFIVGNVPTWMLKPVVKSLLVAWMSPTDDLFRSGGILVNFRGERFGQEEKPASELAMQEGSTGFIVIDESIAKKFNGDPHYISTAPGIAFAYFSDYKRGRPDLVREHSSVEELAQSLHLPLDTVKASLEGTNLKAPFVTLGPVLSMLTVTEGALSLDENLNVTDASGQPIPGLYAVGAIGQGGMLLKGHGHHIGWAMTSGLLAGEKLAEEANTLRVKK